MAPPCWQSATTKSTNVTGSVRASKPVIPDQSAGRRAMPAQIRANIGTLSNGAQRHGSPRPTETSRIAPDHTCGPRSPRLHMPARRISRVHTHRLPREEPQGWAASMPLLINEKHPRRRRRPTRSPSKESAREMRLPTVTEPVELMAQAVHPTGFRAASFWMGNWMGKVRRWSLQDRNAGTLTCGNEPTPGLEPGTARLQVGCATNCATSA
jgi:hypothetical protein